MRAITLTQPWATLVTVGAKRIETRSWSTRYRGVLAIHAAKTMPREARELCYEVPFLEVLNTHNLRPGTLPRGHVIAVAELVGVMPTEVNGYMPPALVARMTAMEQAFGHYGPGRMAWILANVRRLKTPIYAHGALGLWEWAPPADLDELLEPVVPAASYQQARR